MTFFNLLLNPDNLVLKLISINNPDLPIYHSMGYKLLDEGNRKYCENAAHEYWEENYVPDEKRILND